ncbi:hypothetical protein BDP27DRAFT_1425421 [Rhodocollybia butyracea]|uniref:Uncharacterized protein n=1 Tax=Rhodocollybia butyracea TaxID=206335 RepID=A0A9P5U4K3_9AGAR|nr:hypothetical protein BDP27DRAFT_1425421 [Rhodocollybia butyracea]
MPAPKHSTTCTDISVIGTVGTFTPTVPVDSEPAPVLKPAVGQSQALDQWPDFKQCPVPGYDLDAAILRDLSSSPTPTLLELEVVEQPTSTKVLQKQEIKVHDYASPSQAIDSKEDQA